MLLHVSFQSHTSIVHALNFSDFEDADQEEEQDMVPEEPEVRISREEVIARYQVCLLSFKLFFHSLFYQAAEVERDRLKSINLALQQRLADYLHKRKV